MWQCLWVRHHNTSLQCETQWNVSISSVTFHYYLQLTAASQAGSCSSVTSLRGGRGVSSLAIILEMFVPRQQWSIEWLIDWLIDWFMLTTLRSLWLSASLAYRITLHLPEIHCCPLNNHFTTYTKYVYQFLLGRGVTSGGWKIVCADGMNELGAKGQRLRRTGRLTPGRHAPLGWQCVGEGHS